VQAMLPDADIGDDTLAEIYAQSQGNPLFVQELAEGLRASGGPVPADGGCEGPPSLGAGWQARGRVLSGMRLALMDDPLRRVLGLAAAADTTEVSLDQLRAGAAALEPPVALPVLFDALDRALRMRLLEERDGGYAFRHAVVRAALYDWLPRHRRDELRAALAVTGVPDLGKRFEPAAHRIASLHQGVAQAARAIRSAAADTAVLLEQRADLLGRPTAIDYPTEIKRWRVLADQAAQIVEHWDEQP
jgi:hypothetical protein